MGALPESQAPPTKHNMTHDGPDQWVDDGSRGPHLSNIPPTADAAHPLDHRAALGGASGPAADGDVLQSNGIHTRCAPDPPDDSRSVREHIVQLSALDQIQFRSYVRFYFFYPTRGHPQSIITDRFITFFKRVVAASPFLAGRVGISKHGQEILQVCYAERDVDDFQPQVNCVPTCDFPYSYEDLCDAGVPPSVLPGHLLTPLPNYPDETRPAPVFATQLNFIPGGLIVTIFLHHGVSDGASLALLLQGVQTSTACVEHRPLTAAEESHRRASLFTSLESDSSPRNSHPEYAVVDHRDLEARDRQLAAQHGFPDMVGRVFTFSTDKLKQLKSSVAAHLADDPCPAVSYISTNDALSALLWHAITRARFPSYSPTMEVSQLVFPVNVRNKLSTPVPSTYFGAVNVLAPVSLPIKVLASTTSAPKGLVATATAIRRAIMKIGDDYVREVITLAKEQDDVRNLRMAGNFRFGADLAITTQANLGFEDATLDMGLGRPEWIRKVRGSSPCLACVLRAIPVC